MRRIQINSSQSFLLYFITKKDLNLRIKMFWIEKLWFLPDFKWSSKTKNRNLIFWVIPGCNRVKNLSFEFVLGALRYIAFCLDNNNNRGENETKHDKVPLLLRSVSLETSIYTKTKLRVARQNASDQVTISVSFAFDWLREDREFWTNHKAERSK